MCAGDAARMKVKQVPTECFCGAMDKSSANWKRNRDSDQSPKLVQLTVVGLFVSEPEVKTSAEILVLW
jgi:hypothetical protein